jgi:tRNA(Ile)-lysidine synthase
VTAAEFAALMARLGPFESRPRLAVAVSGGADSLALALLTAEWAGARGGSATGLTVDHGLRPESAAEAEQTGRWLAAHGIAHAVLAWPGTKPAANLQAAARAARYGLLGEWCRANFVLHLLLAHHRDDQAETLLLRLGRGSGVDGLSAMAAINETAWGRLLRPLLEVPKARLPATLAARGQAEWVSDPSNGDPAYARARLRRLAPAMAAEGLTADRLAATARRLGRARAVLEQAVAAAAVERVVLHPGGWAILAGLAALPEEIGLRLLARLLLAIGGGAHPPRLDRLERLRQALMAGASARTLAGCRMAPLPDGGWLICREAAKTAPPLPLEAGQAVVWDGRFRLQAAVPGLSVGALGVGGWRRATARMRQLPPVPGPARVALPALYDDAGLCAVPHLGYNRDEVEGLLAWIVPATIHPLAAAGRCLVPGEGGIISRAPHFGHGPGAPA